MRAKIVSQSNGRVSLQMDAEAARAVFASIVFASRFHEGIASLSDIAERGLGVDHESHQAGRAPCQ
jgi:hypothetical protein